MMKQCFEALIEDPATEIIVLVSKPPYKAVEAEMLEMGKKAGKPVVVCFIGGDLDAIRVAGLYAAVSLEDAARKAEEVKLQLSWLRQKKQSSKQDRNTFAASIQAEHSAMKR